MQIFEGVLSVAFSQGYIASDHDAFEPDVTDYYLGQHNGLLGAARDGWLFLTIGAIAEGDVGLSVDVAEDEPPLDDSWEECVEASFAPATPVVTLVDWDRTVVCEIPLPEVTYRVRYTARGMDAGYAYAGTDVYGLGFWPAPSASDTIIRQTSTRAAYWHARVNELRGATPED